MSRREEEEKRKELEETFKIFVKDLARVADSAADFLTNFQYDKWFAKLTDGDYLSKFMSWFNKNKMNEQDFNDDEITDENAEDATTFDEKNKFDEADETIKNTGAKSADVLRLEKQLTDERTRREAAETKLVGVQKKFDEIKIQMERETNEMRARLMKTLEDRAKQGQFNFLTALLPVLDNLNLAISASAKDSSFEHLLEGVRGTARSFEQALVNVGVEPVQAVGTSFNPELHEAVDMIAVAPESDEQITAEYSRGYKFGEKLLRPAKVQVGKAQAKQSASE